MPIQLPQYFLVLSCFSSAGYAAQKVIETAPTTNLTPSETVSEVIVITGSHHQTELLTLTGNIDRISSEYIESAVAVHPSDLLNKATGVHIQANNGMESLPSLRSPVLTGPGAAGAFLFLEDGIATRAAGFANNNGLSELNLAQAKAVEIIRGPASAVYGSNAVHGVVNVLTKAPSDQGNIGFFVGPNDKFQLQGSVGKENGSHSVGANIQAVNDGGYRDNSDFESMKLGLRHDYVAGDDQVITTFSGFTLDQKTAGFIKSGDNGDGCFSSSYTAENLYKDRNAMTKNCDNDAFRKWTSVRVASNWQRDLNDTARLQVTPYFRINDMEFRQHYLPSRAIEENSHYSVGMASKVNWQLEQQIMLTMGLDLEWTDGELTQTQEKADTFGFGKARQQGLHYDYDVRATNIAPYVQGDWQISDNFKLSGSIRFDAIEYDYKNLLADGTTKADGSSCMNNNNEAVACLYQRPSNRTDTFENISGKLGFNYRINENMALFGDWSQGFRAPQVTDLYRLQNQQVVGEINPEEINSQEIGLRGVTTDLIYEVVAYNMTKKNFFFRDARGLNVTDGKTSHQGLELSIDYKVSDKFNVGVNYSYGEHEYDFDRANNGVLKGNEIDTAPRQLANIRLGYKPTEKSNVTLEWLHMGDYYLDPANEHEYAGHDLFQLKTSMHLGNNIKLFARIENLTDEKYASRADYAFGSYRFFGGQPRALHLGISNSF